MRLRRRALLLAPAWLLPGLAAHASRQVSPPEPWPEVAAGLPQATWSGSAQLRFLGSEVYHAQLWVTPGFRPQDYADNPLALSLTYKRRLRAAAMAERSLAEMRRQGPVPGELADRWEAAMRATWRDVDAGDRLTGLHQPQQGAHFWFNGQPLGSVHDPEFSRRFFGIWLDPRTSQPDLRLALLAGAST